MKNGAENNEKHTLLVAALTLLQVTSRFSEVDLHLELDDEFPSAELVVWQPILA